MTDEQTSAAESPPLFSVLPMPADLDNAPFPDKGPYYLVGRDRAYIHKNIHQGRVILPVNKIDALPDPMQGKRGFFWYNENIKLPGELVGKVWSFFRAVYNRRGSEAMVFLTYHNADECPSPRGCYNKYHVFVPPQRASGGGVEAKFNPEHLARGFRTVGTIHSHCDFGAFHSGTDTHDADGHDGLHMTIGKVKSNPPEIATMVSVNGIRWDFKPEQVIDGELKFNLHPRWWERYIEDPIPINQGKHISQWVKDRPNSAVVGGRRTSDPFPGRNGTTGTTTAGTPPAGSQVPATTTTPGARTPATTGSRSTPAPTSRGSENDKSALNNDDLSDLLDCAAALEWANLLPAGFNAEELNATIIDIATDLDQIQWTLDSLGIEMRMEFDLIADFPADEEDDPRQTTLPFPYDQIGD